LASVLAIAAAASAPAAAMVGAVELPVCDLIGRTFEVDATTDAALTESFTAYGAEKRWWTGGDSTYSVPLSDHRTAWLFSDTLIGNVDDDGGQAIDKFVNSSIVVQQDDQLVKTVTGGSSAYPTGLLPPTDDGWYWLGASHLTDDGSSLDIIFPRFERFGPGMWDWGWDRTVLGRFDPGSFNLDSVVDLPSDHGVTWASWVSREGDHTLIYGVEDLGLSKYMHVARVAGDDLTAAWEYWNGIGWSSSETDSVRIMPGVANEYSVAPYDDGYLLVTHDTNELFSRNILAYTSCSPTGPFTRVATLYSTPETGQYGSYGNPNIFTYNAHEHPELRADGSLLVTYNVNSFDTNDLYADATIYRPRFIRVDLQPGS
jgi:hypothetical protein